MIIRMLLGTLACLAGFAACATLQAPPAATSQAARHFEAKITVTARLDYLLFLPRGYDDSKKRWPLMLFLHGSGQVGTNLARVKTLGPPMIVESVPTFPFILVSPQSPVRTGNVDTLNALLDDIVSEYRVDRDRVYLTGVSMGGRGTWALAAAHPEKFAAIAPLCGVGNPADAPKLARLPIWAFQGAKDPIVRLAQVEQMIEAVKAVGANVKLTVYPDAGHDIWTRTYNDPEFYRWLLAQKRR